VAWAPGRAATLLSASDDGLVSTFDFEVLRVESALELDVPDKWSAASKTVLTGTSGREKAVVLLGH